MLDTDNSFPFYADLRGNPLQNGKVWYGTSGQNPITNPVSVYWDSAGTQPASQPITINNGRPSLNGAPARVWVNGDYSRLVQDNLGRQVLYEQSVQPAANAPKMVTDYATLRAYAGSATMAIVTDPNTSGTFAVDATDVTSADNGGTIIVANNGKRWKRLFTGGLDARWFGASTASGNNQAVLQAALDYLESIGGGDLVIAGGAYKTKALFPKRNTQITIRPDSALVALTDAANNYLFGLTNTVAVSTSLTTAAQGTTQITVASTAGFSANDLIIVSSGRFTGSGAEDGPLEFNTVKSVDDATHMTVDRPLKYGYTAFGFAGGLPRVDGLGPKSTAHRNIRITGGGKITPDAAFNSIYFLFNRIEDVEIDHIHFDGQGSILATGNRVSKMKFHHNVGYGKANVSTDHSWDVATMTESIIESNSIQFDLDAGGAHAANCFVSEVGCRDNIIRDNIIGPVTGVGAAGIEFTFNSFGNRIQNNFIYGRNADIVAGSVTLGIRTFGNSVTSLPGNIVTGNTIRNIMQAIGEANLTSVVANNVHENDSLHAFSTTVNTLAAGNGFLCFGNTSLNINRPTFLNNGTPGGFSVLSGSTDPGADWGAVGSIYLKKNGAQGQSVWFRELDENGAAIWLPRNQPSRRKFADVGAPANGTMFYVTDGASGTNPLVGGGTGCLAIRQNGAWKGL